LAAMYHMPYFQPNPRMLAYANDMTLPEEITALYAAQHPNHLFEHNRHAQTFAELELHRFKTELHHNTASLMRLATNLKAFVLNSTRDAGCGNLPPVGGLLMDGASSKVACCMVVCGWVGLGWVFLSCWQYLGLMTVL
jgi:hypothetical protein